MILHLNVYGGGKHRHAHSQFLVSGVQGESSLQYAAMELSRHLKHGRFLIPSMRLGNLSCPPRTGNNQLHQQYRREQMWRNLAQQSLAKLWFMMFLCMGLGSNLSTQKGMCKQKWQTFGAHRCSLPWLVPTTSGDRFHMLNAPVGLFWSFLGHDAFRGPWQGNQRSGHKSEPAQGWILLPNKVWKFWTGCTWLSWEKL